MSTICRIGIFIICAQTIIHFRAKPVYEKYLKLLLSAMILVQLLMPIYSLMQKMDGGEFLEQVLDFREEVDFHFEQITGEAFAVSSKEERLREVEEWTDEADGTDGADGTNGISNIHISHITIAPVQVEVD